LIARHQSNIFDDSAATSESLAAAFDAQTGFRGTRSLSAAADAPATVLNRIHAGKQDQALLLRGAAAHWPALHRWQRNYLLDRWGDVGISALMGLPAHGVPFLTPESELRRHLPLRDFWNEMDATGRCYAEQQPLSNLPGLADDLRIAELMGATPWSALNLWLGRGTKSGLHFDPTDNFLIMVRGHKLVVLAAPDQSARLYPFLGLIMKSRVDVERPEFTRFPRAAAAKMHVVRIAPGDVLYIPAGWWHHVSSPTENYHISINCSFGRELSLPFLAARLVSLGPQHVARLVQDFVRYGLLGRSCGDRAHTVPNGLQLYRAMRARWHRSGDTHDAHY